MYNVVASDSNLNTYIPSTLPFQYKSGMENPQRCKLVELVIVMSVLTEKNKAEGPRENQLRRRRACKYHLPKRTVGTWFSSMIFVEGHETLGCFYTFFSETGTFQHVLLVITYHYRNDLLKKPSIMTPKYIHLLELQTMRGARLHELEQIGTMKPQDFIP